METNKQPPPPLVQDRKTGDWYNPLKKFAELMNSEIFKKVMENLKNR